MAKHTGQKINGQRIVLDGESYERCEFTKCVIVYRGGELASLTNCAFHDCRFELEEAAQRTLEFLNAIYHGFGDVGMRLVEETFNNIRRPRGASATAAPAAESAPKAAAAPAKTQAAKAAPPAKTGATKPAAGSSSAKRSK